MKLCLLFGTAFVIAAAAQITAQFEAASVKPDGPVSRPGPGNVQGGPGTADPTRITYNFATLKLLVMHAYDLQDFQVSGPGWITSERYTIAATMPPGATKEQLQAMLRNLLDERFKLRVHRETKVFSVYELTVAKGGSKLRVSPDDAKVLPPGGDAYEGVKMVDGVPRFPEGTVRLMMGGGAEFMISAAHQPVSALVKFLQSRMRTSAVDETPVLDKTGLTGFYDFAMKFTPPLLPAADPGAGAADPGMDVFTAVEHYLGLKLEPRKDPLETVVIDSAEKVPTGN